MPAATPAIPKTAKIADKVVFYYVGRLDDGEIFDETPDDKPAVIVLGKGMVMKAMELAVEGMKEKEVKRVYVMPEDGFGEYNESMVAEYPLDKFPSPPETGSTIELMQVEGKKFVGKVLGIKEDKAIIDLNHPLAGKRLIYDILLFAINPKATAKAPDVAKKTDEQK